MVAAEQKLFEQIELIGNDFHKYRKYGLYVFRFFKNGGKMYYVIIDDRLPALTKENG